MISLSRSFGPVIPNLLIAGLTNGAHQIQYNNQSCNIDNIEDLSDKIEEALNDTFTSNSKLKWNRAAYQVVMLLRSLYGIETDWITVITEEINISLATTFAQIYCQLKFVNDMTMEVRYLHIYSTTNLNDPVNSSSSDSFEKSANVVLECGLGADNLNKKAIKAIVTTVDDNCPIGNEQTTDFSLKMLEQSAPVVCNWTVGFLSNSKPYGLSFMLNEPFLLYCEATLPVNRQWNFFGFRNFCFTQPKPPEVQYRICTTEPLGTASSTMATVPHTHAQTTSEEYRTTTRSKAVSISSSVIIWFLILFTL